MSENNFLRFDDELLNILTQSDYLANTQRQEGFSKGKASSSLMNKIIYQMTSMVSALGEALKNKGYTMNDGSSGSPSWDDLVTELGNIITEVDMVAYYTAEEVQAYVDAALVNASTPVGSVVAMATDVVPSGFLKCNGAAVSRTAYINLFNKIGTIYGTGDGSTTFNLPDYRGMFFRGWNNSRADGFKDPDVATRSSGDAVGSTQINELKSHKHAQKSTATVDEMYGFGSAGQTTSTLDNDTIQNTGGNETRPNNIYVMYVIKH